MAVCIKGCGAEVMWYVSYSNREKNIPLDPVTLGKQFVIVEEDGFEYAKLADTFEIHFRTCPNSPDRHPRTDDKDSVKVDTSSFTTIRVFSRHKPNGDERCAYITLNQGNTVSVYKGNKGLDAITNPEHRDAYKGFSISIPVSEYEAITGTSESYK